MNSQMASVSEIALGIWSRRKWLLLTSFTLLFTALAALIISLPSLYRTSTTVLFGQDEIAESFVTSAGGSELEQRLEVVRRSILSRRNLQEMIELFDLYPAMRETASPEDVVGRMRRDITIEQEMLRQPQWGQNASFAVTMSYQGWDPDTVADVTNEIARRYRDEIEGIRMRQASRTATFLEEQLQEARLKYLEQEERVNAFKAEHLGRLPQQEGMNLAALDRVNGALRLNRERQMQLMSRRQDLVSGTIPEIAGFMGATDELRLERLKRRLAELSLRYTANHPDVVRVQREIDTLEQTVSSASRPLGSGNGEEAGQYMFAGGSRSDIDSELARLREQEQELRAEFSELQEKIANTPSVDQALRQINNEYDNRRSEYLALQSRYRDASLAESLEHEQNRQVRVLEGALAPEYPSAPQTSRLMFMALMLSAGMSAGLVMLREQSDRSFHSTDDLYRFTSVPVIASIARIQTFREKAWARSRFILFMLVFVAAVFVLARLSFEYGVSAGDQIVWMIS